jgi:CDGSH-type Zn-finger protein
MLCGFPEMRILPMSDAPKIAQTAPYPVEVEAGKSYFWCSCGQSSKQPFCDGSHQGRDFAPVKWEAPETKKVFFCGCKHSGKVPLCDGAHNKL